MTTITKLHLNGIDYDIGSEQNVKVFTLANTSDLVNAQAAYDWYVGGGYPVLYIDGDNGKYTLINVGSSNMRFSQAGGLGNVGTGNNLIVITVISFTLSSGSVTSVTKYDNRIKISSTAPTTGDNSIITLVV